MKLRGPLGLGLLCLAAGTAAVALAQTTTPVPAATPRPAPGAVIRVPPRVTPSPAETPRAAPIPAVFHGIWVRAPGGCANLAAAQTITIAARSLLSRSTAATVTEQQQLSLTRITVALLNEPVAAGAASFTSRQTMMLSADRNRLLIEQTQHNGTRLPPQPRVVYRRCSAR